MQLSDEEIKQMYHVKQFSWVNTRDIASQLQPYFSEEANADFRLNRIDYVVLKDNELIAVVVTQQIIPGQN
jgi:hypothetical protein